MPIVGGVLNGVSQIVGGYNVGSGNGHAVAGALLGREGALGASSSDGALSNKDIRIGDAYSTPVVLNRDLGAAIGGVTTAAMRYGMGKVFGSKAPLKQ